jgi:lipoprotein-releasing system permease protein
MASFSIVATLILLVLQKRKDIAVLRTLGASKSQISRIFHFQGSCIGALGTLLGMIGSYLACLTLKAYRFPLDSDVFPVSELPIRLEHGNVFLTAGIAFLICSFVTLYPARRAAQVDPAKVLRYE